MEKYDLCFEVAKRYYRDALKDLKEASIGIDIDELKAEYVERIEEMMSNAIDKNDMKTALKCQDMLNKINQLYVERKEVDVSMKNLEFKFGDE